MEPKGIDGEARALVRVHRVIARLNVGGPALHVVALNAGLDEDPSFAATLFIGQLGPGEGDMTYLADEARLSLERVPHLGPQIDVMRDLRSVWWLYRRFRRDQPHIVHTHTAKAGALGRLAAVLARVPVRVHTYHGHVLGGDYFSAPVTTLFQFVEQTLARVTHRLVTISPLQSAELKDRLRLADARKLRCIPLGLNLDAFRSVDRAAVRPHTRKALGVPDDAWVVATVGRLVPVKNHGLLLAAFARALDGLAHNRSSARLLIVGDGDPALRVELERQAAALGITDQVQWLGWRTDLPQLLAATDVFALTSNDEGTPVAVIEALCAGTPVVARSVGGVPDVVRGVPFATSVDSDSPVIFAEALLEHHTLTVEATQVAQVREQVAIQYSAGRLVQDTKTLYREVLVEAGISPRA